MPTRGEGGHAPSFDELDRRVETTLVWALRLVLLGLAVAALARGDTARGVWLVVVPAAHIVLCAAAARLPRAWRARSLSLADAAAGILAVLFSGVTGAMVPLLAFAIGLLVAAAAATRLRRWSGRGRLLEEERRLQARVEELTALQTTAQGLNSTLDVDTILQVVLDSAIHATGATHGSIMLTDLQSGEPVLRVSHGYSGDERAAITRLLSDVDPYTVWHDVLHSGEARMVADVDQEPAAAFAKPGTRSALVVPILSGDMVVGLVSLCRTRRAAFTLDDLAFVEALAGQAAVSVGNAVRFENEVRANSALGRRTEQMDRLLAVNQKLRADVPLAEVLEDIVYAIQETVGFDVVIASVVRGTPPVLEPVAAAGLPVDAWETIRRERQPVDDCERVVREARRQGDCCLIPGREHDGRSDAPPEQREPDATDWQADDTLLVPLRGTTGALLGHISVRGPAGGLRPASPTLQALILFGHQAALAIENAALYADAQQRAESLALLNVVGRRLTQAMEPAQVMNEAVRAAAQLLRCEHSGIFVPDPLDGKYAAVANHGAPLADVAGLRFAPGEGLVGQVALSGEPLLIPDTELDERYVVVPWPIGSILLTPLRIGRRVVGVLTAGAVEKHALGPAEQVLLTTLADQLAIAIHNARMFAETQRRVAELAAVNEVGRAISGTLDTEQLYDLIYTQLGRLLDTRNLSVALYDAATETIHFDFQIENGQRVPPEQLKLGEGLTGYVIRSGRPLFLPTGSQEFRRRHGLALAGPPARSWVGVPMVAKDRVIGTITLQSYERENAFDQGHVDLLVTVAGQAAVAFQNVALFEERERRIAELATLNEMGRTINSALNLEALLSTVEQQVSRVFDTTNFFVATYEQGDDQWVVAINREHGRLQAPRRYAIRSGLAGYILRECEPVLLLTRDVYLAFHELQDIRPLGEPARSWMGVPLVAASQVVGVMAIQSYEQEHAYSQQDLALFSTIAAQAAVAMRNAQLYQQVVRLSGELEKMVDARTQDVERALAELTRQRDRAEALYRITSELATTVDLGRALDRSLRLFADALSVEHGTILLLDADSGYLVLRATLERDRELPPEGKPTQYRRGVGLAGWVLERRQAVLVPDAAQDTRWLTRPGKETSFRSVVAAPLLLGREVLGVLTLGHPSVGYFSQEHLQVVTAAAAQVAVAVNRSDLYAHITRQAHQLGEMLHTQRSEAAQSRAILESIADGVLVLDPSGQVLLLNPVAEELLGLPEASLQGKHFRHILGLGETAAQRTLAQVLYAELRKKLEDGAKRGDLRPTRVRLEAGNRVIAASMSTLIDAVGGNPGLVAVVRDMSREAEVERLKNEFISTVSHELRTPMTSIKGFTDLLFLGMAGDLTEKQLSFLQIIKANVDRLTALVNDILDISRIETGRARLTIESLALAPIITQVVTSFQTQFRDKGVTLTWQVPAGLPRIRGDAARVTQILTNLIANACNYTPAGGRVAVTLGRSATAEGLLQVDVADTGIGIAPDDLGRVFDRFYRADHPLVQAATGSGLGLAIVKMFVEMMGGRVWVESSPNVGSTFHVTLPAAGPEQRDEEP